MPAWVAVSTKRNPLGSPPHGEATDESTIRARSLAFNAIRNQGSCSFQIETGSPVLLWISRTWALCSGHGLGIRKAHGKAKNALTVPTQAVKYVDVFMECFRLSPHPHSTCGEREPKNLT